MAEHDFFFVQTRLFVEITGRPQGLADHLAVASAIHDRWVHPSGDRKHRRACDRAYPSAAEPPWRSTLDRSPHTTAAPRQRAAVSNGVARDAVIAAVQPSGVGSNGTNLSASAGEADPLNG